MAYVPFNYSVAVTPSDSTDIAAGQTWGLYVGGTGDLVAVYQNGVTSTFTAVPAGAILPIRVKRVNSTSTTATGIVALYQV